MFVLCFLQSIVFIKKKKGCLFFLLFNNIYNPKRFVVFGICQNAKPLAPRRTDALIFKKQHL